MVKNLPANAGDYERSGFDPWVRKIPWRRAWQPIPVFLLGESHGQKSLVAYSAWSGRVRHEWAHTHIPLLKHHFTSYWLHNSFILGCSQSVQSLSCVWLFVTPWTVALQAPLSVGFHKQEYWNGLPFPSPGDLPNTGIELMSPVLQADSLSSESQGKS